MTIHSYATNAEPSHRNEYKENAMSQASNVSILRLLEDEGEDVSDLCKEAKRRVIGMSFTKLPDGRFVQIAGEHEDFYDSDFYIYNDVIVHSTNGKFTIYGYPKDAFPPTDFHTATLVDGFIYIIGSLGYQGTRRFGETPIYRLNCKNWSIESVQATGDNPGWIFKHNCRLVDGCKLVISGGEICKRQKGKEKNEANTNEYELDLATMKWTWKS